MIFNAFYCIQNGGGVLEHDRTVMCWMHEATPQELLHVNYRVSESDVREAYPSQFSCVSRTK